MNGFERINEKKCWEMYGWGTEAKPGTDVLHGMFEVFVDEMNDPSYGGVYGCEIYARDGDMVGQWFDESPEKAVMGAVREALGL